MSKSASSILSNKTERRLFRFFSDLVFVLFGLGMGTDAGRCSPLVELFVKFFYSIRLFSGDIFMPLPYIVDGDIDQMIDSLQKIGNMSLENIVQGHGDVVLRGEIESTVEDHIQYLSTIRKHVRRASRRKYPLDLLQTLDVESCGKSRVLLGGLAEELHQRNMVSLYTHLMGEPPVGSDSEDDEYEY